MPSDTPGLPVREGACHCVPFTPFPAAPHAGTTTLRVAFSVAAGLVPAAGCGIAVVGVHRRACARRPRRTPNPLGFHATHTRRPWRTSLDEAQTCMRPQRFSPGGRCAITSTETSRGSAEAAIRLASAQVRCRHAGAPCTVFLGPCANESPSLTQLVLRSQRQASRTKAGSACCGGSCSARALGSARTAFSTTRWSTTWKAGIATCIVR